MRRLLALLIPVMLKNHLLIALRNLRKRPGYTLINVVGLAVGMAACLLIAVYIHHERGYDRFHEKADRIYRVVSTVSTPGETHPLASSQAPLAPALAEDFPEVQAFARLYEDQYVFSNGSRQFQEKALFYADPSVFDVFSFTLAHGDPATALREPFNMVMTEVAARRYFGSEDPVGQTLTADGEHVFTVTGILDPLPKASHLEFDVLVSMATREAVAPGRLDDWFDTWLYTYVLVEENGDVAALESQLADFVGRRIGPYLEQLGLQQVVSLQPLTSIHLYSDRMGEPGTPGNPATLPIFAAVALFLLLTACINFMNLSTARSTERVREVGVRKMAGAQPGGLIGQFLTESIVLAILGMIFAHQLAAAILPHFHLLSGVEVGRGILTRPEVLATLLGAAVIVGVLAGIYPAFVLSRFRPIQVLKGASSPQGAMLRRGLVVFQFAISITLISGTLIVHQQLDYIRSQDLGFDSAQKLVLRLGGDGFRADRVATLKEEFLKHPGVLGATASSDIPGVDHSIAALILEHPDGQMRRSSINFFMVDDDFVSEYDLETVAGRVFYPGEPTDSIRTMVVNEAALRHFGFLDAEQVIGRRFRFNPFEGVVIGVIRDFHYATLHKPIEPLALWLAPGGNTNLTLNVATSGLAQTLADLEEIWQRIAPHHVFDYAFLDDKYAAGYAADQRFGRLFGVFAGLAIFIACMGLFGLAAFTAEQRTKEIGVRKVLGASVTGIVALLSRDFLVLVFIALVFAFPAAYFAMQQWLQAFAYRIVIGPAVFVWAGLAAMAIALLTISYRAIRAAMADPVKGLRYE